MEDTLPVSEQVRHLAFQGDWQSLLPLLRQHPELINAAGEGKGYTPLHQAAWHGADLPILGELLNLGADRDARTFNKGQTAQEVALDKHPIRDDLQFLLASGRRTIAQLMRKINADDPGTFADFDGGRLVFHRMMDALNASMAPRHDDYVRVQVEGAFAAITGHPLADGTWGPLDIAEGFPFHPDAPIWRGRLIDILRDYQARDSTIPLEKSWSVIGDLFLPEPTCWDLRGDHFLWQEMQRTLSHVPIPEDVGSFGIQLEAAFLALVGERLPAQGERFVPRFAHGGMSSGMISMEFWSHVALSLIMQRADWLRKSWSGR